MSNDDGKISREQRDVKCLISKIIAISLTCRCIVSGRTAGHPRVGPAPRSHGVTPTASDLIATPGRRGSRDPARAGDSGRRGWSASPRGCRTTGRKARRPDAGGRRRARLARAVMRGRVIPWGRRMSGEIRQNKVTKEWVIYAPVRGQRPHDHPFAGRGRSPSPPHEPTCPFCPGNEHMLTSILAEWPGRGDGHWQARVVPNRYPVLSSEGSTARSREGIYVTMQGYGHHEVIIESPRHDDDIATMSSDEVLTLLGAYHQRFLHLRQDDRILLILIFRNHGPRRRLARPPALAADHDRHGPAQYSLAGVRGPAALRRLGALRLLRDRGIRIAGAPAGDPGESLLPGLHPLRGRRALRGLDRAQAAPGRLRPDHGSGEDRPGGGPAGDPLQARHQAARPRLQLCLHLLVAAGPRTSIPLVRADPPSPRDAGGLRDRLRHPDQSLAAGGGRGLPQGDANDGERPGWISPGGRP